ncbi:hypothetical protein Lal_00041684 [Lupinus albus]|nr:hypothetical protein Lal_00041684 [Lupinus albus]
MASQNEENKLVSQTPDTQKRTPRGMTLMKKVIRVRSKNVKLSVECNTKGQPLYNKGGKTLVSYIGVVADWKTFVTTRTQDDIFLKLSDENRKRASKPLYPYRASRAGYTGVEKKL